jgi:signal transduction histidine kinase
MFDIFIADFPWILAITVLIIGVVIYLRARNIKRTFQSKENKIIGSLEERDKAFRATAALNAIVLEILDFETAVQQIVNVIPKFLGYETGVLALVDEERGVLRRIAVSETAAGMAGKNALEIPFKSIEINLTETDNFCIKALHENRSLYTTNVYDVLRPVISQENSKIVQAKMGTKTTLVYPIFTKGNKPFGTFIVSMAKEYDQISEYEHQTIKNFVDGIRIVLRNATLYTSLAKTKEELQIANIRLQQLDKLKDEFVSVASHELRTPMTAIKSYLWMAIDGKDGSDPEKHKYYLERAYSAVDRLMRLVNDMLNVSRIDSGRVTVALRVVDLGKLVQEVFDEVMPRAQELGLNLIMQQVSNLPQVVADSDKVKEVLINLIGNALKFTPKGGSITVSFVQKDTMIETVVTDSGTGIDPANIGKLFQKFSMIADSYRADSQIQGTGLGLYICKSIIELHGGKIWATSEGRGKGTQFAFSLKVATAEDIAKNVVNPTDKKIPMLDMVHTGI